ncbi:MAG: hypothetical protein ACJAU2_000343 [Maribacter sp.]|jgi:hypothetical protein
MYRSPFLYQAIILWIFIEIDGVPALKKSVRVKAKIKFKGIIHKNEFQIRRHVNARRAINFIIFTY